MGFFDSSKEFIKDVPDIEKAAKAIPPTKYKESFFPFGIAGTFGLILAIPLLTFYAIYRYGDPRQTTLIILPVLLFISFILIIYNHFPSSFQNQRTVITSFTGGVAFNLLHAGWPFSRLIIYGDGLEVRFLLSRFFIPYDKMEDVPEKTGFFRRGMLIKSNLPEVPNNIWFQSFRMKRVIEAINQNKNKS